MDLPEAWTAAVEAIVSGLAGRVVVIGANDSGKSTFCRALLHRADSGGRRVALVDADVGQKMVGPPAAVTRCHVGETCSAPALAFVGTTDPVRGFPSVVSGTRRLAETATADLVVINTSGLLFGPGRALKAAKIAATRPHSIVAIGGNAALDQILAAHPKLSAVRLPPSPFTRRKTRAERRRAREESFRRYFEGADTWDIAMRRLREGHWPNVLDGLLVGLVDRKGNDLALGIMRKADAARNRVELLAPGTPRAVGSVIPGKLRLDLTGRESPI